MDLGTPTPGNAPLPIPLPSFLEGNPYFQAGFGLALMGVGLQMVKRSGYGLQILAKRSFLTTLEVTNRDASFPWITQWLHHHTKDKIRRVTVETSKRQTQSGKSISSFSLVPSQGRHFLKFQKTWLMVERDRELRAKGNDIQNNGAVWESIKFTTIGRDANIFSDLMSDAQELTTNRDHDVTTVYSSWGHHGWKPLGNPKKKRDLSSVILDKGIDEKIVSDVYEFMTCREWYYDRGIPYRRGYLLYGEPGSGKSSFVTALAGHIGYDICSMSLSQPGLTDDHFAISLINVPEKSLILFEDVDCLFHDRNGHSGNEHDKLNYSKNSNSAIRQNEHNYMTFSGFLNALDGVYAGEERLVFMTTNFVDRLDPALIRPGRVDYMEYFGNATKYQIEHMFYRFYPECVDDLEIKNGALDNFVNKLSEIGVSMATLQGYFLINKNNVHDALYDIDTFVNELRKSPRNINKTKLNVDTLQGIECVVPGTVVK